MLLPKITLFAGAVTALSCAVLTKPDAPAAAGTSGSHPAIASLQGRGTNTSKLYEQSCAKCHGYNAEGGGGGTPSLISLEKYDQKLDRPFFDAIKNGVKTAGMDPYGETLSDAEIWALVVHIRELQTDGLRQMYPGPKPVNGIVTTKKHAYKIETVVEKGMGLKTPWGMDWLPDGTLLITNRPGGINIVKNGQMTGEVKGLPPVIEIGQGGLMEVKAHPNYASNGWIYLGYTDPAKDGGRSGMTKIVRGKLKFTGGDALWINEQTLFQCAPDTYNGSGVHFGCRIVFDKAGFMFFSIGERGNQDLAQDLSKPNGKVYRLKDDGTVPADNPFVGKMVNGKPAIPAVWSYGHRNPQGLVIGLDGTLWDTEHGPRGGDEVNRIQKGANYGWPLVAFSINYNDSPFRTPWPTKDQNITMPVFRWIKSIGACGLDVAKGPAFPNWKGDLLAGGLSGANVDRIRIKNDQIVEREEIFYGQGRVRDVSTAPDGTIYIALNGPDKVVRLVPVK